MQPHTAMGRRDGNRGIDGNDERSQRAQDQIPTVEDGVKDEQSQFQLGSSSALILTTPIHPSTSP